MKAMKMFHSTLAFLNITTMQQSNIYRMMKTYTLKLRQCAVPILYRYYADTDIMLYSRIKLYFRSRDLFRFKETYRFQCSFRRVYSGVAKTISGRSTCK